MGKHKHGCCGKHHRTPEYESWRAMIARCTIQNAHGFQDYGGRGIVVCDEWQEFEQLLADMGARPAGTSLDRIDNAKGYNPNNCRWATDSEQQRNRRDNINATVNGRTLPLTAWAEELNIPKSTLFNRFYRGRTPEEAVLMRRD